MERENYTKIPNEILGALAKTKLTNYELRYLWVVMRKTYGWNKLSDYISNSQFVKETGIKKYHIWRTEKRLLWKKIVTKRGNKVSINTNYGEWKELPIGATVTKSGIKVTNRGKKVTNRGGHKEHHTKNTKQRKDVFSFKDKIEAYKKGDRRFKPFNKWGEKMRWVERKGQWRWEVIPRDGGSWLEFAGSESEEEIKWKQTIKIFS